jgi:hypothetical protein
MSASLPIRVLSTALLFTACTLTAQTVVVRGEIQSGRATGCYYCPSVPWALKYSETPITSSTVNLSQFLGVPVELTGNWNGSATAPGIDVTFARVVAQSFSFAGTGRIGGSFRFTANGTPGDLAVNTGSLDRGFVVPLGTLTFLLDPSLLFVAGIGPIDASGQFRTDVAIPNNPAFVGMHVFGQSLIVPASGPLYTTSMRADFVQP